SVTIPMALLYGVLFGLGRWSADREFVAMQACGVSVFRILRPILVLAILAAGATAYETIVGWRDVFLADSTRADETTVYVASAGRLVIDREKQTVTLLLERGSSYT